MIAAERKCAGRKSDRFCASLMVSRIEQGFWKSEKLNTGVYKAYLCYNPYRQLGLMVVTPGPRRKRKSDVTK